jgi:hypothetical protein
MYSFFDDSLPMPGNLTIDSPEVPNWVQRTLDGASVPFYFGEGYSVKDGLVTGLFERRISSKPIDDWKERDLIDQFRSEMDSWIAKATLARILKVPLYFVIYQRDVEGFLLSKITETDGEIRLVRDRVFDTCKLLASWLSSLKGIHVSKGFVEVGRLSIIDKCLRFHGTPWPGNLDGFVLDEDGGSVSAIFEMSRTRARPVRQHDIVEYYSKDVNRWKALEIFKNQAGCSMYVILWSSDEKIVKLLKVKTLSPKLSWESEGEIVSENDLVRKIKKIIKANS